MRKLGKLLFDNGYLIALVIAAVLVFRFRGVSGFVGIYIPIAVVIAIIQIVMVLSKNKSEDKKELEAKLKRIYGDDYKKLSRPSPVEVESYDYSGLPEMADIISNGNQQVISDIALLVHNWATFIFEHPDWCGEMGYTNDDFGLHEHDTVRDVFADWLCGYDAVDDKSKNPALQFGASIDWKQKTDDIIWALKEAGKNLGYTLELDKIIFSGDEFTDKALNVIGDYLLGKGYMLIDLDTESDSYHLFIIQGKDYDRLIQLAKDAGFNYKTNFC